MLTVLHVAPHPDDESVGSPCALLKLAASGARVIVATCGLGRPEDHVRRRQELMRAVQVGGFELMVPEPPMALGSRDDQSAARESVTSWLHQLIEEYSTDLVISPHLHDVHPAHETVAAAVRDAIAHSERSPVWWSWGIWADLRNPTLLFPCSAALQARADRMLAAYHGELSRNDYRELVRAAGKLAAVRGVERVLGFGSAALPNVHHAELLTELGHIAGRWRFGILRVSEDLLLPTAWADYADDFAS